MGLQRRSFLTLLGGAAAAWPMASRAQQQKVPVIGFIHGDLRITADPTIRAFYEGLSQSGFVEGQSVTIEYRLAKGHYDLLPAMAAELVRRSVAAIVAPSSISALLAARAATTTIPIVFMTATDPVQLGLIASLSRPGGNLTGVTTLSIEVVPKRFELLREILPTSSAIALLLNPKSPSADSQSREAQAAARTLGIDLNLLAATSEDDIDAAFANSTQLKTGGLVIAANTFFHEQREQIADLALRNGVPTIGSSREFATAGGLMSYGTDFRDLFRIVGTYTGRILKGDKPADLPVQQATKVELVINVKTAKALGLAFPLTLLGRADEVIE